MKQKITLSIAMLCIAITTWASPTDLPSMTLTTTRAVGETITLTIDATEADRSDIWIDLNNDGTKQDSEAVTTFDWQLVDYTLGAQTITIYGKVTGLDCANTQLTTLDIGQNSALQLLSCSNNSLTALDIGQNSALEVLDCYNNELTALDITQNSALVYLGCSDNQLTVLDITQNSALKYLDCSNNELTALDVSHNPNLISLFCQHNAMTTEALDTLYTQLPDISNVTIDYDREQNRKKQLKVAGNPGAKTSDTQVATNKGWIVDIVKYPEMVTPE